MNKPLLMRYITDADKDTIDYIHQDLQGKSDWMDYVQDQEYIKKAKMLAIERANSKPLPF